VNTAEVSYGTVYPTIGFGTLAALGGAPPRAPSSSSGCYIDNFLASNGNDGGKDGSSFSITSPTLTGYSSAYAVTINSTGTRLFCSDQTGVIYALYTRRRSNRRKERANLARFLFLRMR
jgi:hypothetical protein